MAPALMTTLSHKDHVKMRKSDSPAFTKAAILQSESEIDELVMEWTESVRRQARDAENGSLDMSKLISFYSTDSIGIIGFGQPFGLVKDNADTNGLAHTMALFIRLLALLAIHSTISPILVSVGGLFLDMSGTGYLLEVTKKCIKSTIDRQAAGHALNNICVRTLAAKRADGARYTFADVQQTLGQVVAAGEHTTSSTICATLCFIVRQPRVYAKLQAELDQAVQEERLHVPPSYAEVSELPYLQACIKETLRVHAPPWLLPRVVSAGGTVICGRFFPAGCEVAMDTYVLHRQKEAFGDDAEDFRPERWIEASEASETEKLRVMERCFIPFGSGQRICIGRNIANVVVSKIIPHLLLSFEFSFTPRGPNSPHQYKGRGLACVDDDTEPWRTEQGWLQHEWDFWVDVKERSPLN